MSHHYNPYTMPQQSKKTMAAYARHIEGEKNGGVSQIYFDSRFSDDQEHTRSGITRILRQVGIPAEEMTEIFNHLSKIAKKTRQNRHGHTLYEDEDIILSVLRSKSARAYCEKQGIKEWMQIVTKMQWRENTEEPTLDGQPLCQYYDYDEYEGRYEDIWN